MSPVLFGLSTSNKNWQKLAALFRVLLLLYYAVPKRHVILYLLPICFIYMPQLNKGCGLTGRRVEEINTKRANQARSPIESTLFDLISIRFYFVKLRVVAITRNTCFFVFLFT